MNAEIAKFREIIIRQETEFPKAFTNYEERDYGILFHNAENGESYDSNHAVIYPERIVELRPVLHDIASFYRSVNDGLYFSVYHPFVDNYFINNAGALKECGYQFTICPDARIMLLTGETAVSAPRRLEIKRIEAWSERAERDVLACVENKPHFAEVLRRSMGEGHYLFIGYLGGEAVSLLAFTVSELGITRFDEMGTAIPHRNRGFAREMNGFAADCVRERGFPVAYQWPAHKTSERITTEAGFRVAFTLPAGYACLA